MIGHPLSDQALKLMDAFVESLFTRESKDGAEGTVVTVCIVVSREEFLMNRKEKRDAREENAGRG